MIRTILSQKNRLYYQAGGGIVSKSNPQKLKTAKYRNGSLILFKIKLSEYLINYVIIYFSNKFLYYGNALSEIFKIKSTKQNTHYTIGKRMKVAFLKILKKI